MSDPFPGFQFCVEIDSVQEAYFTECSGLEMKVDVEEYKEGGLNDFVHKLPGRQSFSNVTLKRGMVNSTSLWDWLHKVATEKAKKDQKKNISIVLYHGTQEAMRWNLIAAYPIKWSTGSLQTDQSAILIESLELAYQEFSLQKR